MICVILNCVGLRRLLRSERRSQQIFAVPECLMSDDLLNFFAWTLCVCAVSVRAHCPWAASAEAWNSTDNGSVLFLLQDDFSCARIAEESILAGFGPSFTLHLIIRLPAFFYRFIFGEFYLVVCAWIPFLKFMRSVFCSELERQANQLIDCIVK